MTLPAYVLRGGELVFQVPYAARNATQFIFLLRADAARLAATFARDFGTPSGGAVEVRPAMGLVILSASRIPTIKSAAPPDSELGGGISELEVAFLTVGIDVRRRRPVVCVPYLFVDSGMAVAAGRELFGLPKQHGFISIEGGEAPARITVDALSIERFDPPVPFTRIGSSTSRRSARCRVRGPSGRPSPRRPPGSRERSVRPGDLAPPPAAPSGGFRSLLDTLAGAFDQIADEGRVLVATLEDFITGTFPLIGLKQFRDVAQSDRACYQAITEAPMKIVDFHRGGLLGEYVVNLGDLASEPIRQDLGLPPGPIRPLLSAWLRYDFRLEAGVELERPRASARHARARRARASWRSSAAAAPR